MAPRDAAGGGGDGGTFVEVTVERARGPVGGRRRVPASKSLHQRALALSALADDPVVVDAGPEPVGEDVLRLARALGTIGSWQDGALGRSRERMRLDLGLGATGFRFTTALATLRPPGARTLVTGRPALLRRPHRPLRRALTKLGAHVVRRWSGAMRVVAGGVRGGALDLCADVSSQFVSALLLVAPRIGGVSLRLLDRPVSRPYLELTIELLRRFGVEVEASGLDGSGGVVEVGSQAPRAARIAIEADASSAVVWWALAAWTGGSVVVEGLPADSRQADVALAELLVRMGARVETTAGGEIEVTGTGALDAPGTIDLGDRPDLLPIVGALAATARGTTRVVGVAHARHKESDRRRTTAAAITALGGTAEPTEDGLVVRGGPLSSGVVDAAGDHRIALAFGALGAVVGGVVVRGADAVGKSLPGFWRALADSA